MKCSVLLQKPTQTKHVMQQATLESVGSKSKCRTCVAIHGESVHEPEKMTFPVRKIPALLLSLSHRVSADALVAGRKRMNTGGRI